MEVFHVQERWFNLNGALRIADIQKLFHRCHQEILLIPIIIISVVIQTGARGVLAAKRAAIIQFKYEREQF
jgi:hypothetical protein